MGCVVVTLGEPEIAGKPATKFSCMAPGWEFLEDRQRNDYSQFGEDGLIEAVLERIGETNRWCFEVGAADGLFMSNTKRLRDAGWSAVLIEGDRSQADKCEAYASHRVQVVNEQIGRGSLDKILAGSGAPIRLDLGVIDIDGQDYWAWEGLKMFRPRVMLVEFGYWNPPDRIPQPNEGPDAQAGLQAIIDLGVSKGYVAVARTLCNVLFVDREAWESN